MRKKWAKERRLIRRKHVAGSKAYSPSPCKDKIESLIYSKEQNALVLLKGSGLVAEWDALTAV